MHWCKFWKEEWCQPWRSKILSLTRDIFYTLVSKQQALLKYIYTVDSILIHQYSWLALLTTTTKTTKKSKEPFQWDSKLALCSFLWFIIYRLLLYYTVCIIHVGLLMAGYQLLTCKSTLEERKKIMEFSKYLLVYWELGKEGLHIGCSLYYKRKLLCFALAHSMWSNGSGSIIIERDDGWNLPMIDEINLV